MIDEQPPIIETEGAGKDTTFPVIAQLSVLGVFLFLIFGGILFSTPTKSNDVQLPPPNLNTVKVAESPIPQKISPEEVSLGAAAAYVWDVKGQRALYAKNATEALPLASITKLMTTLVAYELTENDSTTVISLDAIKQEGSSGFSSGERLNSRQLSDLALISSSNDAAYALAASVGTLIGSNDPVDQFVTAMNIKADELELPTLQFWNTTGLDLSLTQPGSIGSAKDVSFLMEHIIRTNPQIITSTQLPSARIFNNDGTYHDVHNTNKIAEAIPNLIGSKTGYTDLAGGNLTIAFDAGFGRPIVVTVLGSTRDQRFDDVMTLVEAVQETVSQTN